MRPRWGQLSGREKGILAVAALIVVVFLVDRFVLSPVAGAWEGLDREVSVRESRLIHDRALISRKESLMKDYRAYTLGSPKSGVGEEKMALLKEIGAGAKASGVKITDIKPVDSREGGVSLSTESSWESLAAFLYLLQRSPRMLQVERASIRAKGEGTPILNGQLLIAGASDRSESGADVSQRRN